MDRSSSLWPDPTVIDRGGALGFSDPGQQLIVNGSFEGSFTGWTTQTTGFTYGDWTVATPQAGFFPLLPIEPQDGNSVALNAFDGFDPMEFRLYQDVAIPAGAAAVSLTWKDRIQWDFTFGGGLAQARTYTVEVLDPTTGALLGTVYSFSTGSEATNPTGNTGMAHAQRRPYGVRRAVGAAHVPRGGHRRDWPGRDRSNSTRSLLRSRCRIITA